MEAWRGDTQSKELFTSFPEKKKKNSFYPAPAFPLVYTKEVAIEIGVHVQLKIFLQSGQET